MTLSEVAFKSGAAIVKKGCAFNSFVTFTCLCLVLICLLQQIIFNIIELELHVCIFQSDLKGLDKWMIQPSV